MIFRIFYFYLFLLVLACNPPLKLSESQLSGAKKSAQELKSQSLVVRVPTQGRKINFLRQAIYNPELDNKSKMKYERVLKEAMESDKKYLATLDSLFKAYYTVTPVFFVPDSSFLAFKAGAKNVFVDGKGQVIPYGSMTENFLLLLSDDSPYKMKLFNKEGYRLPNHMPHKKDAFLPFIQVMIDKQKYLADQIIFFDTRLKEIEKLK